MVDFGIKIRELRKKKGLTQQQLAEYVGVTKAMVSAYETGMRYPSYDILIKFTRIFRVTSDYLLGLNSRKFFDVDGLTDSQAEAVANIIEEFKKMNTK